MCRQHIELSQAVSTTGLFIYRLPRMMNALRRSVDILRSRSKSTSMQLLDLLFGVKVLDLQRNYYVVLQPLYPRCTCRRVVNKFGPRQFIWFTAPPRVTWWNSGGFGIPPQADSPSQAVSEITDISTKLLNVFHMLVAYMYIRIPANTAMCCGDVV
jgi:hypothetical protein